MAKKAEGLNLTAERKKILRQMVDSKSKNSLTDPEFETFLIVAGKYDLDPWAGEIVPIKHKDGRFSIMTTRDGYLKIGHRSGELEGIKAEVIEWDGKTGRPIRAKAWVFKKGCAHPFEATVKFSEFNNNYAPIWKRMPEEMIVKVAMSRALRFAFPLSGLVTAEEMGYSPSKDGKIDTSEPTRELDAPKEKPQTDTSARDRAMEALRSAQTEWPALKDPTNLLLFMSYAVGRNIEAKEDYDDETLRLFEHTFSTAPGSCLRLAQKLKEKNTRPTALKDEIGAPRLADLDGDQLQELEQRLISDDDCPF